jgi:hypothetical protein
MSPNGDDRPLLLSWGIDKGVGLKLVKIYFYLVYLQGHTLSLRMFSPVGRVEMRSCRARPGAQSPSISGAARGAVRGGAAP